MLHDKNLYPFYDTIMGLCHNKAFIKEVKKVRKLVNIPEEGLNYFNHKKIEIDDKVLEDEISRIEEEYEMTYSLKMESTLKGTSSDTNNFKNIILYNFVVPPNDDGKDMLYYSLLPDEKKDDGDHIRDDDEKTGLVIKICKPVKIYTLFKFIRGRWPEMEDEMKKLIFGKGRMFYEENLEILELINAEGLSYAKAGNEMFFAHPKKGEDIGNNRFKRDMMRQRYLRSMRKVEQLFYKK